MHQGGMKSISVRHTEQVYIVANGLSHAPLAAWAAKEGLPPANVLNTGRAGGSDVVHDVAFALGAAPLDDSHLVRWGEQKAAAHPLAVITHQCIHPWALALSCLHYHR